MRGILICQHFELIFCVILFKIKKFKIYPNQAFKSNFQSNIHFKAQIPAIVTNDIISENLKLGEVSVSSKKSLQKINISFVYYIYRKT